MRAAAHISHADAFADARDVERAVLGRRGVLRIGDRLEPSDIVILDLTRDGCGVQGDAAVTPGLHVEIGIANVGRVPATVLWCGTNNFGCMFDRPLPAGAVTAASGPRNVLPFPSDAATGVQPSSANKLAPLARVSVVLGAMVLCWSAIGALAFAVV